MKTEQPPGASVTSPRGTRRLQHLVGSGDGTVFVDARAVAVRWSRPTAADSTTWTVVETGKNLVLPPGEVWWEIVPIESPVTLR